MKGQDIQLSLVSNLGCKECRVTIWRWNSHTRNSTKKKDLVGYKNTIHKFYKKKKFTNTSRYTYLPVTAPPTAIAAPPIMPRPRPTFQTPWKCMKKKVIWFVFSLTLVNIHFIACWTNISLPPRYLSSLSFVHFHYFFSPNFTTRPPYSLSLSLSFPNSLPLSLTLSYYSLCHSLFLFLSLSLTLTLCVTLSLFLSLLLSLTLTLCVTLSLSLSLSLTLSYSYSLFLSASLFL